MNYTNIQNLDLFEFYQRYLILGQPLFYKITRHDEVL